MQVVRKYFINLHKTGEYLLGATISYCTETVSAFLVRTNWKGFSLQEQNKDFKMPS